MPPDGIALTRPPVLSKVLDVVYRAISSHLLASARVRRAAGHAGAVTLIQRFGSTLNLRCTRPRKATSGTSG